jgi:hypothetical protein
VSVATAGSRSSAIVSRSTSAKVRSAATASSSPSSASSEASGSPKAAPLPEQEQRDRLRRQQCRVHDQRLGGRVQPGRLLDRQAEGLRHRQAVVVLGRRVSLVIEQPRRRRREAPAVLGQATSSRSQ